MRQEKTSKPMVIRLKRIIVNTVVIFVLGLQFASFVFNTFTMRKPETVSESLYQDFIIISSLCSEIAVFVFLLIYNFKWNFLKYKITKAIFLVIAILAAYIYLWQLFVKQDLIIVSSILLLIDCYVLYAILHNSNKQQHNKGLNLKKR